MKHTPRMLSALQHATSTALGIISCDICPSAASVAGPEQVGKKTHPAKTLSAKCDTTHDRLKQLQPSDLLHVTHCDAM